MPSKKKKTSDTVKSAVRNGKPLRVHEIGISRDELMDMAAGASISLKAHTIGEAATTARSEDPTEQQNTVFQQHQAIEPPFDPRSLIEIYEASSYLRPNVDSYATNIDGFGHRFEPTIDLESDSAPTIVRDAMAMTRLAEFEEQGKTETPPEPTDKEVEDEIKKLKRQARLEKFKLDSLFNFINPILSFPEVRKRTRVDLEIMGNAYWEVLRSADGDLAQVEPAVGTTVRLLDKDPTWVDVEMNHRTSSVTMATKTVRRRFRKIIQLQGEQGQTRTVWFKEFGDPRTMSAKTGTFFDSPEAMATKEGAKSPIATEIVHFMIYSPRSSYGVPRYIGSLISVLGSRHADEVNFLYFENKSVPPLALLVSGGKIAKPAVERIRDFIQNELRGKRNYHKVLVIEAEGRAAVPGTTPPQQPKLELKPLTDAQQHDALFQNYDKRNSEKIGAQFRVPPILRGETAEFNRATAIAAKAFAEEQVFEPERTDFDFLINRLFLADMGILLWRFRSLAPIKRDPAVMAQMLERLVKIAALNPAEARIVAADILNMDLSEIKAPWAQQPLQLTLAGFAPGQVPGITAPADDSMTTSMPGNVGSMQAADTDTEKKAGDLGTGDLDTGGGRKKPAQGIPKEVHEQQVRDLRARLRALAATGLFENMDQLINLASVLKAKASDNKNGIDSDPSQILTLEVPPDEWAKWWETTEPVIDSDGKDIDGPGGPEEAE